MRSLFELRRLLRPNELALAVASLAEASLADEVALPSQLARLPVDILTQLAATALNDSRRSCRDLRTQRTHSVKTE